MWIPYLVTITANLSQKEIVEKKIGLIVCTMPPIYYAEDEVPYRTVILNNEVIFSLFLCI